MPPKFIFLRHGEATHNVAYHKEGPSIFKSELYKDAKLTEEGIVQAKAAGETLSSLKIAAIWSSPLTRCIQTALEVFEEVDCDEIYLHDALLERQGNGYLMNERQAKFKLQKEYSFVKMQYLPDLAAVWFDHENSYALRQRMFMLVMLLADIYKDENESTHILLVGHSDAISTLTGRSLNYAEHVILSYQEILNL